MNCLYSAVKRGMCLSFFLFIGTTVSAVIKEKSIVVVIPSYNNAQWYQKNLASVFNQQYENYRVIYIDDCSTDNTGKLVEHYIKEHGQEHRVTLIHNKKNMGALTNIYAAVHIMAHDHDIIVTLDGDDWFAHDQVLRIVNDAYNDSNVWLTYGQFRYYPGGGIGRCKSIPELIISHNMFRDCAWVTSHLRTFYAWLFKQIKREDLLYEGNFFDVAWDVAFMLPMLEMASERIRYIPTVLYEYNVDNPINDFKVRHDRQLAMEDIIRQRNKYTRLERAG